MSVIWITGLSGSGKTTLAKTIFQKLKERSFSPILIDGDEMRKIFKTDKEKYNTDDRLENAWRICKLSNLLSGQGNNVIVSTMSLFDEIHKWNRKNFNEYYEVFLDIPISELIKRDSKNIYSNYKNGLSKNVVGLNLDFDIPINSDLVIKQFEIDHIEDKANYIILKSGWKN